MVKVGLSVRLEAKPERAADVQALLQGGLDLARREPETISWYAFRIGPTTFGIYDTFEGDAGRNAHLQGPIAAALMARAGELLAKPPIIEKVDVLAAKTP